MSEKPVQNKMLASGRYEILSLLAEGGMGKVFLATDHNLDTKVVIKIPHAAMLADPEFVARFQREIRSLVKLRHRSIVSILDVGEQDGVPFAVMQFMEGKSLEDRLESGPQSEAELQAWLPDVAIALDFVHREGYVHRDIKPGNILFDREGNAYVGDFGVIKVIGEHEAQQTSRKSLTGSGMVMGTPEYMAPELVMGEKFDHRVDQYALAATIFECLCGRHPFEGAPHAVMVKQTTEPVPSVRSFCPAASAQVESVVNRGLSKKRNARFESCSQLAAALLEPGQVSTPPGGTSATATQASPDQTHKLSCPGCGARVRLGSRHAGKAIKCPSCKTGIRVADDLSGLLALSANSNQLAASARLTASNAAQVTASRAKPKTTSTGIPLKFVIPGLLGLLVAIAVGFMMFRKSDPELPPTTSTPPVVAHKSPGDQEISPSPGNKGNRPESGKSSVPVSMAIISVPSAKTDEEISLRLKIDTTQPRVGKTRLQLKKGAPSGMNLDSNSGMLTWTPTEAQGPATYSITIELTDETGRRVEDTANFEISVKEVNLPPVVSAILPQVARANKPFRFRVVGSDPDIPANDLHFSLMGEIPDGLAIDDRSGELTWDVSYRVPQSAFSMTVTLADSAGLNASRDLELKVVPLLPLTVPFEPDTNKIAETAALGQKLAAEQTKQPEEFVNQLGARFRLIPQGKFAMGSSEVIIAEPFYVCTTEVTQGQWSSLMGSEVSHGRKVAEGQVSPSNAEEFCRKLTALDGIEYRVPTEAEWEFACRAGTETEYAIQPSPEGDESKKYKHFANVKAFNRTGSIQPVGISLVRDNPLPETILKQSNGFGLFDMHGNVSELCRKNGEAGFVARGGSFESNAAAAVSTASSAASSGSTGLRLVAVPGPKTQTLADVSASNIRTTPEETQNSVGMEFVLIHPGQFKMGAADGERSAGSEERPQHLVEITRPFYLGRFEVSQAIYAKVMDRKKVFRDGSWRFANTSPSAFSRKGHSSASVESLSERDVGDLPVESISWMEADEFCKELDKLVSEKNANRHYRLPTEAEWEYACRAGSDTPYSFGKHLNGADANVDGNHPYEVSVKGPFQERTEVVGRSSSANSFGLFDMHGNVAEWCQDFYSDDYFAQSPKQDPQGPPTGNGYVLKGGSWNRPAEEARSASRRKGGPDLATAFYGFRVVLEAGP